MQTNSNDISLNNFSYTEGWLLNLLLAVRNLGNDTLNLFSTPFGVNFGASSASNLLQLTYQSKSFNPSLMMTPTQLPSYGASYQGKTMNDFAQEAGYENVSEAAEAAKVAEREKAEKEALKLQNAIGAGAAIVLKGLNDLINPNYDLFYQRHFGQKAFNRELTKLNKDNYFTAVNGKGKAGLNAATSRLPEGLKDTELMQWYTSGGKDAQKALVGFGLNAENFVTNADGILELTEKGKKALGAITGLSEEQLSSYLTTEEGVKSLKELGKAGDLAGKSSKLLNSMGAMGASLALSAIDSMWGTKAIGWEGQLAKTASDIGVSLASNALLGSSLGAWAGPVGAAASTLSSLVNNWIGPLDGVTAQDRFINSVPVLLIVGSLSGKKVNSLNYDKSDFATIGNSYAGTFNAIDKFNEARGDKKISSIFSHHTLSRARRDRDQLQQKLANAALVNDQAQMVGNTIKNNLDLYQDLNNTLYNGGYKWDLMLSGKLGLKMPEPRKKYIGAIFHPIKHISVNDAHRDFKNLTNNDVININVFKTGGEIINKYEQGKNIIPEGALHARRHHMEDAKNITKKGIPVVFNGEQQAEIECNEIIFRKEVSEKIEKYWKDGSDEAAIKCGELLVKEILYNTQDYTGLIDTIEALKKGGTVKPLIAKNQQKRKNSQMTKLRSLMLGANIPIHRNVTGGVSFLAQPTNLPQTDNSIDALEFALMLLKQDPNLSNQLMEILKAFIQEYADLGKHNPEEWALAFQEFAQQYNLL